MVPNDDDIKTFWEWFASVSDRLLTEPDNPDIINSLDNFVRLLGDNLDWEIGPIEFDREGKPDAELYLAISPCLDPNLLSQTRKIVSLAPICKGWLFLPAKPQKGWVESWEMLNELAKGITVNASEWKYVLYQFEDDTFDMDIWVSNIDGNLDTKYLAVDIAITNLLGEERFMQTIKNIKIVREDGISFSRNFSLLKNLDKHLMMHGVFNRENK